MNHPHTEAAANTLVSYDAFSFSPSLTRQAILSMTVGFLTNDTGSWLAPAMEPPKAPPPASMAIGGGARPCLRASHCLPSCLLPSLALNPPPVRRLHPTLLKEGRGGNKSRGWAAAAAAAGSQGKGTPHAFCLYGPLLSLATTTLGFRGGPSLVTLEEELSSLSAAAAADQ